MSKQENVEDRIRNKNTIKKELIEAGWWGFFSSVREALKRKGEVSSLEAWDFAYEIWKEVKATGFDRIQACKWVYNEKGLELTNYEYMKCGVKKSEIIPKKENSTAKKKTVTSTTVKK